MHHPVSWMMQFSTEPPGGAEEECCAKCEGIWKKNHNMHQQNDIFIRRYLSLILLLFPHLWGFFISVHLFPDLLTLFLNFWNQSQTLIQSNVWKTSCQNTEFMFFCVDGFFWENQFQLNPNQFSSRERPLLSHGLVPVFSLNWLLWLTHTQTQQRLLRTVNVVVDVKPDFILQPRALNQIYRLKQNWRKSQRRDQRGDVSVSQLINKQIQESPHPVRTQRKGFLNTFKRKSFFLRQKILFHIHTFV